MYNVWRVNGVISPVLNEKKSASNILHPPLLPPPMELHHGAVQPGYIFNLWIELGGIPVHT